MPIWHSLVNFFKNQFAQISSEHHPLLFQDTAQYFLVLYGQAIVEQLVDYEFVNISK